MRDTSTSTIAQLLFTKPPQINFAHMVGELDCALAHCPAASQRLSWDCEDVAIFDLDDARIVLAFTERPGAGHAACLTISVGPGPEGIGQSPLLRRAEALCRLVADRVQTRAQADAILWHQTADSVTTDLLDGMAEAVPPLAALKPRRGRPIVVKRPEPVVAVSATPPQAAYELPGLRSALYPVEDTAPLAASQPTPAQRLAVHALNATLVMVSLPVGAAMVTYAVLRGGDMRMTGHAMALTGAALAFAQTGLGQSVMALI